MENVQHVSAMSFTWTMVNAKVASIPKAIVKHALIQIHALAVQVNTILMIKILAQLVVPSMTVAKNANNFSIVFLASMINTTSTLIHIFVIYVTCPFPTAQTVKTEILAPPVQNSFMLIKDCVRLVQTFLDVMPVILQDVLSVLMDTTWQTKNVVCVLTNSTTVEYAPRTNVQNANLIFTYSLQTNALLAKSIMINACSVLNNHVSNAILSSSSKVMTVKTVLYKCLPAILAMMSTNALNVSAHNTS